MSIGQSIKSYLDQNGISQKFLATKTNIPDNTLSNMLNGKRKISVEEYFNICAALKKPYDFFKPAS